MPSETKQSAPPDISLDAMSRLDTFLKNTGVFKARTQARKACDEGRVLIDGIAARGSRPVHVGMRLHIITGSHRLDIEVRRVPDRSVARAHRDRYVAEHSREALAREVLSFDDEP